MDNIDINKLLTLLEQKTLNIIDIRTFFEYQQSHIPTAKYIDKNLLITFPQNYLKKNEIYYIYCQSGNSSNNIVKQLNLKGYTTVNIIGGFNNYLLRK